MNLGLFVGPMLGPKGQKEKTNKAWKTTMINGAFHAPSHLSFSCYIGKQRVKEYSCEEGNMVILETKLIFFKGMFKN